VSKERAHRRTEREREAAIRRAARAAQAERRERRQSRRHALHAATVGRVRPVPSAQQTGILARRHRQQTTGLITVLVLLNLVVWVVRGDWPAVLGALVVSALVYPVLKLLLFARH
jgi:Flp pilus assembly protein TadB